MKKNILIYILFLLIFAGCSIQPAEKSPLNILWIIADDYSPDAGVFGTPGVHTPNIDQLAKEGRIYNNAFATNPVCSPSRSAIYTGMYQTTIGAHQHRTEQRATLPDSVEVITSYFKKAGYFTCNGDGTKDSEPEKTDFNFQHSDTIFDGSDWSQREQDQPFFASVQIHWPHRVFGKDPDNPVDTTQIEIPPYYPDHPVTKVDWANYLESVQLLDQKIGEVIQRLENEGLADNTVIFFFADQGRPMVRGKQWLYDSGIKVPLIVKWPDRFKKRGQSEKLVSLIDISAASMTLADIDIPSHLQGINFLDSTQQRPFIYATRNRTDAVVDYIRCVRNKRYKYIKNFMPEKPYMQFGHYKAFRYPVYTLMKVLDHQGKLEPAQQKWMAPQKPEEELYDIAHDPFELNNLADDAEHATVLVHFRNQLEQWMEETNDMGDDDPDNYQALLQRRQQKYRSRWEERGIDPKNTPDSIYLEWWEHELGLK